MAHIHVKHKTQAQDTSARTLLCGLFCSEFDRGQGTHTHMKHIWHIHTRHERAHLVARSFFRGRKRLAALSPCNVFLLRYLPSDIHNIKMVNFWKRCMGDIFRCLPDISHIQHATSASLFKYPTGGSLPYLASYVTDSYIYVYTYVYVQMCLYHIYVYIK